MTNYINVNRTFSELPDDLNISDNSFDFESYLGASKGGNWDDLLKLNRAVILARAGAGKTEELKQQTQRLRERGKTAFFFLLELLSSDFEMAFGIGTLKEFNEWLEEDTPAWFFIDSVDEARLIGPKQFEKAILRLSIKLAEHKQRVHIYITSRDSVWRPFTDLELIKEKLSYIDFGEIDIDKEDELKINGVSNKSYCNEDAQSPKNITPTVYSLIDLDNDQVKTFATAYDVADVGDFLKAVHHAEAEIYTGRPQDLIELINYWNKHQKIAGHAVLIKESIELKLKEQDPDRAKVHPLSIDDAMYGAEVIAAAVTFTQQSQIMVPDRNNTYKTKDNAINIQELLKNWDEEKVDAILQRPIFDKEIYGTVRFHHRSEREYLSARWIVRLLNKGHARQKVANLFFKEQYGVEIVIASLRPILSWLLIFDEKFHDKVSKVAPELFIQGGDPAAFSVDIRKAMLIKLCQHHALLINTLIMRHDV